MTQILTIKPVDVTKPKVKPQFSFDDNAYQSEGFEVPTRAPGRKERDFLSRVDLKQGIKVQIRTIIRQLAIDYDTENEEEKEYLTWTSDWSWDKLHEFQYWPVDDLFNRPHML